MIDGMKSEYSYGVESQLERTCYRWKSDDPLSNHLKGIDFPGLKPGVWINKRMAGVFEEFRGHGVEHLKSFFLKGRGLSGELWQQAIPNVGMVDGVPRYDGLPLDGEAPRVMDIHNHPEGYPETFSYPDNMFFLQDMDMKVQAVVSEKGTLIMKKKKDYFSVDEIEAGAKIQELHDECGDDYALRDKKFNLWVAKRYPVDLLWIPKKSRLVRRCK